MYKNLPKMLVGNSLVEQPLIKRIADNAVIPFDPQNTDAKEFALWLQDGNKPEPTEEGGAVTDEWVAETIAKLLP